MGSRWLLFHRLGGKPNSKKRGMSGIYLCYTMGFLNMGSTQAGPWKRWLYQLAAEVMEARKKYSDTYIISFLNLWLLSPSSRLRCISDCFRYLELADLLPFFPTCCLPKLYSLQFLSDYCARTFSNLLIDLVFPVANNWYSELFNPWGFCDGDGLGDSC